MAIILLYKKYTLDKYSLLFNFFDEVTKCNLTNTPQPLNEGYLKTLWSHFKRQLTLLKQEQTLYSFRHSGTIEIFKRTGSITKLQKAMGHSSMNVSLTYLRGLEIAELKEEDMPMVCLGIN